MISSMSGSLLLILKKILWVLTKQAVLDEPVCAT